MEELIQKIEQTGLLLPDTLFTEGELCGTNVVRSVKKIAQLEGLFEDTDAFKRMDGSQVAYEVDAHYPVEQGLNGGLFFGLTHLHPGKVGDEYFMTYGHFHDIENRGEYYWVIEGAGMLLLMDKKRNTRAELMRPGSLHYIPGYTAHRVVNTGESVLRFGACWPSDAGHNYATIGTEGFSKRVKEINGTPTLV